MRALRNLVKMQKANDGSRSLFESVMAHEISDALRDWQASGAGGVLIGGLALSFYVKPRMTQDIDILMLSDNQIPAVVKGFKKTRPHAFQHNTTHVKVEIVTSTHVSIPLDVVQKVIETAQESNGFKIASPSGLIAMKLFRLRLQDQADIVSLINFGHIDLTGFHLPIDRLEKYLALITQAKEEKESD